MEQKERILKCLQDFDIPIINIKETVGPSITHYEAVLGDNVKISKIRRLKDDIALYIKDLNPRIIVPIPGENAIGIEIENKNRQIVYFKDIVKSKEFIESQFSLPVIIGSTVTNKPYIADLAKLPHLLVGG